MLSSFTNKKERFETSFQRAAAHVAGWLGYPRLKKLAQSMPMSTSGMFIHFGRLSESTSMFIVVEQSMLSSFQNSVRTTPPSRPIDTRSWER